MLQKIQSYIAKHSLLTNEKPVVVGVSGGADSVVLLRTLVNLGYACVVAHCNFHLRGEESMRDERFVTAMSRQMQLPFYKVDFDTEEYARQKGISIEMAARDLRYEWFEDIRRLSGAQAIAVAHHGDDNIETMLMNLVRGTGLRGLTGIPRRNGNVVRPLLGVSRKEIETYVAENNLDYVIDSTNLENDYQRNKFRNQVIPLLETINPSLRQTLYEAVEHLSEAYDIYSQGIDDIRASLMRLTEQGAEIDIDLLKEQKAVHTVLYELLLPYGFTGTQTKQMVASIESGHSGKQFFSENYRLLVDRKKLIVTGKAEQRAECFYIYEEDSEMSEPVNLLIKKMERGDEYVLSKDRNRAHIDYNKLVFPLVLRKWHDGDFFYPLGMRGKKKLSDFFVDLKLSRIEKERCWILESGGDVVWVVGLRLDNRFCVTNDTTIIYEINC